MSLKLGSTVGLFLLFTSGLVLAHQHREYDPKVLSHGQQMFQSHCAICHGMQAQGTVEDWTQKDQDGRYPPPPLNGTAHTWHHSVTSLVRTIKNGTQVIGGSMPAWKDELSDEEILSIILWLSSLWPEEIYQAWMQVNLKNNP